MLREHHVHQEVACDSGQDNGTPVATVQGRLHLGFLGVVTHANHLCAENREHDAEGGNHQGQQDGGHASEVVGNASTHVADDVVAEHHGRQHRGHVRAKQVGTHAGHVAHVVADVVGDGGRVSGIVFRNAGFHLAHEVRAYVGRLRVDATAHTGEQSNAFGTE